MAIIVDVSSLPVIEADPGLEIFRNIDEKRPEYLNVIFLKSKQEFASAFKSYATVIIIRPSTRPSKAYVDHLNSLRAICIHGYHGTQPESPGVVYVPHTGPVATLTQYTITALTLATSDSAFHSVTDDLKRSLIASIVSNCIVKYICERKHTKQQQHDDHAIGYYKLHMAFMHAKKELAIQTAAAEKGARNQASTYLPTYSFFSFSCILV